VWLVTPAPFGIPIGLAILKSVPTPVVKAVLGIVIVGFSAWSLLKRHHAELKNDRLAAIFGFVAGILSGAYGMNGPPLAVYEALRRWTPGNFRATLAGLFPAGQHRGSGGLLAGGPDGSRGVPAGASRLSLRTQRQPGEAVRV
jgi:uncharacterized membrane protein YfcA